MRGNAGMACVLLLAACAAQEETVGRDVEQAVRDYIEVRALPEPGKINSSNYDQWQQLDGKFIIYATRNEFFLIEFLRNCHELQENVVVADVRRERNVFRARFDTLRGCRIHRIYALTENDVAELSALGRPVGSGT